MSLLYPNGEIAFVWKGDSKLASENPSQSLPTAQNQATDDSLIKLNKPSSLVKGELFTSADFEIFVKENSATLVASSGAISSKGSLTKWLIVLLGICGLLITILFAFYDKKDKGAGSENKDLPYREVEQEIYDENYGYIPDAEEFEIMEDLL